MLQSILNSSTIPLLEKVAIFGERRQEVLAGNIANFSTPGYKMRDMPIEQFREALKEAVGNQNRSQSVVSYQTAGSPQAQSIENFFPDELFESKEIEPKNITFQDANNRSIEHVNMEMLKNTMMQNFAIELMNTQLNMLQTAISERV